MDDCFRPKELPFSPCFAIILKQIRLPSDGKELQIVTEKQWGASPPEFARVHMDAGIIYYKNQQDAEESFEILRKRLFS